MKILFLVSQLNIGGAERQLVIVANELASRGHEVVITSFYTGGALSKQLDPGRVRLISLEKRSRWDLISLYVKVIARHAARAPRYLARLDAHTKRDRHDGSAFLSKDQAVLVRASVQS